MELATLLRFMQLYTHNAHNLLGGPTFFQDHEFLGELYPVYETDYDNVVERVIGAGKSIDLIKTQVDAVSELQKYGPCKSYQQCFQQLLSYEKLLCSNIEQMKNKMSQGTLNLLADIADRSEMRQYKIKQRLK